MVAIAAHTGPLLEMTFIQLSLCGFGTMTAIAVFIPAQMVVAAGEIMDTLYAA